jgi:hypothetical protein
LLFMSCDITVGIMQIAVFWNVTTLRLDKVGQRQYDPLKCWYILARRMA